MKNNHSIKKAILWAFAFFGVTTAGVVSTVSAFNGGNGGRAFLSTRKNANGELTLDPSEYTEVSSAQLVPKITEYTGTSLSRHLSVQFESQIVQAMSGRNRDVFYVVDDNRYSGDLLDPFAEEAPEDKTLNVFAYYAEAGSGQTSLYFANYINYGSFFKGKVSKIAANAMYRETEFDPQTSTEKVISDSYNNLTGIYIFDGITEAEAGALINVPDTVTIYLQAAAKPAGFEDGWTDAAHIEYGWEPDATTIRNQGTIQHSGATSSFGIAEDYILGYKGNADLGIGAYPLTMSYKKIAVDGTESIIYEELPIKHKTNPYDAVGSTIFGPVNYFDFTIDLEKGEDIDPHSFEFYNIFKASRYFTNEKTAWPEEAIEEVLKKYELKSADVDIPSLEGTQFFHQVFETLEDKYITIAHEFDDEESAEAMVGQFKDAIETAGYLAATEYDKTVFGNVYKLYDYKDTSEETTSRDNFVEVFIQFYSILNEETGKYEFVSYIIPDATKLQDILDEDKQPTGEQKRVLTRSLPITKKAVALRPFIFIPTLEAGKTTPQEYLKSNAAPRYGRMTMIDDLFELDFSNSSTFLGYTSVSMSLDKLYGEAYSGYILDDYGDYNESDSQVVFYKGEDGMYYNGKNSYSENDVAILNTFKAPLPYIYDTSSRTSLESNLVFFLKGDVVFRTTFVSLNSASIVVKYKKGNEVVKEKVKIVSPSPTFEVGRDNDNIISFMVNNNALSHIDSKNILAFGVEGITINIHLYNKTSHNKVQATQFLRTFGNIEVFKETGATLESFSIDLYLTIFFLSLTAIYAVAAIIIFFVRKEKYKNDEFRRMNPKAYLKTTLLGYLGLVLIAAMINFIILRFAVFQSTVPVFNPIDPFVIVFGIAGAIAIGFFIKALVSAIKLMKKRRDTIRLKLDKDVVDDGTH